MAAQTRGIPQQKRCPDCGETKGASEFFTITWYDKRSGVVVPRPKLSPYCRPCTTQHTNGWRKAHPDETRARINAYRQEHRTELRAYQAAYNRKRGRTKPETPYRPRDAQEPRTRTCKHCGVAQGLEMYQPHGLVCHTCRESRARARETQRADNQAAYRAERAAYARDYRRAKAEARGQVIRARAPDGYWTCPRCHTAVPSTQIAYRGALCPTCCAAKGARE